MQCKENSLPGAADNSSLLKRSSQLRKSSVSASKKTHFSNCVSFQHAILVKVIPNSGLWIRLKCAASLESKTSTTWTRLKTSDNVCLQIKSLLKPFLMQFTQVHAYFIVGVTPSVTKTTHSCAVLRLFRDLARTRAPNP